MSLLKDSRICNISLTNLSKPNLEISRSGASGGAQSKTGAAAEHASDVAPL
jgi:hypothetical protein